MMLDLKGTGLPFALRTHRGAVGINAPEEVSPEEAAAKGITGAILWFYLFIYRVVHIILENRIVPNWPQVLYDQLP